MAYRATTRTEARRDAVRSRLVDSAAELIAGGGYGEATIVRVAERAGVAVGTVYRHFPSKSELFAEVFREASQREVDAMAAAMSAELPAAARIAAGIETFARRALRARRFAWALLAEPIDAGVEAERLAFRRAYRDQLAAVLREGVAAGELPSQDPDVAAAALVGAIGEALVGPLSAPGGDDGAEATIAALVEFCERAIGKERALVDA
ncbi:MAG: TetR/AcrR family transcriptional regulator [Solirubrobacterales bacterium]|nr:TetR/AcrR family transcriptional regulator [Solirubrobacterales bacterium]